MSQFVTNPETNRQVKVGSKTFNYLVKKGYFDIDDGGSIIPVHNAVAKQQQEDPEDDGKTDWDQEIVPADNVSVSDEPMDDAEDYVYNSDDQEPMDDVDAEFHKLCIELELDEHDLESIYAILHKRQQKK